MRSTPVDRALPAAVIDVARAHSLQVALEGLVCTLIDVVPHVDAAAVLVEDTAMSDASVASHGPMLELIARHVQIGATPVLEACERREPVYSGHLGRELRWHEFSRDIAGSLGMSSLLAIPLTVEGRPVGALVVCAGDRDAFDVEDREVVMIAALHASTALADDVERRQLE